MLYFDPLYLMLAVPGLILGLLASFITKTTFAKYARVGASSGLTGAQAADRMLRSQGVNNVDIEMVKGFLSDHFDPRSNTLRLSPDVYRSQSLSAIGVACHEAGHALQKATGYGPLSLRSALVPVTQFGSSFAYIFFIAGLFLRWAMLMKVGVFLFAAAVVFAIVTLPVEWNATARAKRCMVSAGIVSPQEQVQAGQVLNAAFLTYIAAAVTALLQLLYFAIRAGLLGGHDD
jgi:hypothetical protein